MDLNSVKGEYLKYLSNDDLDNIHFSAIKILKDTGIYVGNEPALKIYAEAGAEVDCKTRMVKIPNRLIEDAIEKTPNEFIWHARDEKNNLKMGDTFVHFLSATLPPFVYDIETGQRRDALYQDCVNFVRLSDSLERISDGHNMVFPQDVPPESSTFYMMKSIVENSDKCMRGRLNGKQNALDSIRIAKIISGGDKASNRMPNMIGLTDAISPLKTDDVIMEGILEYVKEGFPVILSSEAISGGTAPATLAGTLVLQNAEILAHIVFAQTLNPGIPLIYGTSSSVMDMKSGNLRYGAVEMGMINVATAQLARYYKMPSRGAAGCSDSKVLDMQSGYETAINLLLAALGGVNIIIQSIGILDLGMSVSYEKVIIDHEMLGSIIRSLQGIRTDPEALAVEVIKEVGAGGNYLSHPHTYENFKKEQFITAMSDSNDYSTWEESGKTKIEDRAKKKVNEILENYKPKPLGKSIQFELDLFQEEVDQRVGHKGK